MADDVLSWILGALLVLAAVLQISLARKKGEPLSLGWSIQAFIFPAIWLGALGAYYFGLGDYLFPAVMLGLVEELICWAVKRKLRKAKDNT